jgi:two-component system cell cycle sensor histidine kinase/response regulator CckA
MGMEKAAGSTHSDTILLVDDDSGVRRLAASMLEMHGYTVIEAESGLQGLESFTQHHKEVRLILSDVVMPQMTGTDMIQRIRNIDPSMPVMLMTGYAADIDVPEAVPILSKPFTLESLIHTVESCLAAPAR